MVRSVLHGLGNLIILILAPLLGASASTPNAPSTICIDDANCAITPPRSSVDGIKWHPGNYASTTEKGCSSSNTTNRHNLIAEVNKLPHFKGTLAIFSWGCLEQGNTNPGGTNPGDYSNGFAIIDDLLSRTALGKQLMVIMTTHEYDTNSSCADPNSYTITSAASPAYARTNTNLIVKCNGDIHRWSINWGTQQLGDRMIALSRAYGARYNNNPKLESFAFHEETAGISELTSYHSIATLRDNMFRVHQAAAQHWPNTMIKFGVNWFGSNSDLRALIERVGTLPNIAFGVGDTYDEVWRNRRQPGSFVYRGLNVDGSDNTAWSDLRGRYGFIAEIQSPDIGKQYGVTGGVCTSLTRMHNWAKNTLRYSHLVYTWNPWGVCDGTNFLGGVTGSASTEDGQSNAWSRQKAFAADKSPYYGDNHCPGTFANGCNTD